MEKCMVNELNGKRASHCRAPEIRKKSRFGSRGLRIRDERNGEFVEHFGNVGERRKHFRERKGLIVNDFGIFAIVDLASAETKVGNLHDEPIDKPTLSVIVIDESLNTGRQFLKKNVALMQIVMHEKGFLLPNVKRVQQLK